MKENYETRETGKIIPHGIGVEKKKPLKPPTKQIIHFDKAMYRHNRINTKGT